MGMNGSWVPVGAEDPDLFWADLMGEVPPPRGGSVVSALRALRMRTDAAVNRARRLGGERGRRLRDREQRRLEQALDELLEQAPVDEPGVLEELVALTRPLRSMVDPPPHVREAAEDTLAESLPPPQRVTLPLATRAADAARFWGSVTATNARETRAGKVAVYVDGDLLYVAGKPSSMRIIRRTAEELFSDTVSREVAAGNLLVAVNGNMFDLSRSGQIDVAWGHDPVPAGATSPIGQVVTSGRVVSGSSQPDRFYVAYAAAWAAPLPLVRTAPAFRFGQGDPPTGTGAGAGAAEVALGGMGPIIVNGLPFGVGNLYRSGVPAGAPTTGPVPSTHLPYLVQRNNNHYASFLRRGASVGKVAVAINRSEDMLVVLVQSSGARSGMDLDGLRDRLLALGCNDAVFGDGSDSALLVVGGTTMIAQGDDKEEATTIGLGFT
jgi:hypothetical protein